VYLSVLLNRLKKDKQYQLVKQCCAKTTKCEHSWSFEIWGKSMAKKITKSSTNLQFSLIYLIILSTYKHKETKKN